jgi:hypothetical protein
MPTLTLEQQCRKRVYNYFTPEVAACVGLSVPGLQQFALGIVKLDDKALRALARRMQIFTYPVTE